MIYLWSFLSFTTNFTMIFVVMEHVFIPDVSENIKPKVGTSFDSLEEAYEYYVVMPRLVFSLLEMLQ